MQMQECQLPVQESVRLKVQGAGGCPGARCTAACDCQQSAGPCWQEGEPGRKNARTGAADDSSLPPDSCGELAKSVQNVLRNPCKFVRCEGGGQMTAHARPAFKCLCGGDQEWVLQLSA